MDVKVEVSIPEYIYKQARQTAERESRPVNDILNDLIVQAFPTFHVHPQRAQMEAEVAAFERQKSELLAGYEGQYVAIYQGNLIDHDDDITALAVRIDEAYPDEIVLIKQVLAEADQELVIRSPRLIR